MTTTTQSAAPTFHLHTRAAALRGLVVLALTALMMGGFVADLAGGAPAGRPASQRAASAT